MYSDLEQSDKEQQLIDNDIVLSYTENQIWDMWRRWRTSEYSLWPWMYATKTVYADDIINLEAMEAIASKLEREKQRYQEGLEESKRNKPNPNAGW